MARVNVDAVAFGDVRFDLLAAEMGWQDADFARGKMLRVWFQCASQSRKTLTRREVELVLGANGADAIVRADLAQWDGENGDELYIRGTSGRIEWLEKLKKNGKMGGRPRKTNGKTKRFSPGKPDGSTPENPLAPAPALVLAPALTLTGMGGGADATTNQPAPAGRGRGKRKPYTTIPPEWQPTEAHAEQARRLGLDLQRQADLFVGHSQKTAQEWADWHAAFRNWLDKAVEIRAQNSSSKPATEFVPVRTRW